MKIAIKNENGNIVTKAIDNYEVCAGGHTNRLAGAIVMNEEDIDELVDKLTDLKEYVHWANKEKTYKVKFDVSGTLGVEVEAANIEEAIEAAEMEAERAEIVDLNNMSLDVTEEPRATEPEMDDPSDALSREIAGSYLKSDAEFQLETVVLKMVLSEEPRKYLRREFPELITALDNLIRIIDPKAWDLFVSNSRTLNPL